MSCVGRFELGAGLFLGWGGASLSILGGGLLCSACRRVSSGAKRGYVTSRMSRCAEAKLTATTVNLTTCFLFDSGYYGNQGKVYTAKSEQDKAQAYV